MIPEAAREALRADVLPFAFAVLALSLALAGTAVLVQRRRRDPALVFFVLATALYGARLAASTSAARLLFGIDPHTDDAFRATASYLILALFPFFCDPLLPARWRPRLRWLAAVDAAFALVAISWELLARAPWTFSRPASVLVLVNVAIVLVPIFQGGDLPPWELRRLRGSFLVLALFVAAENLRGLGLLPWPTGLEPLGFLLFFAGLGTIVARRIFAGETRLAAVRRELDTARRIQTSILPRELPRLPGLAAAVRYLPAEDVAGDFYDFLSPPAAGGRRLGVLVADVSGHGVPAALIASMIKVAVAAQADHADQPAEVLTRMNRIFHGKLRDQFLTAAYAVLDLDAMRLRWANAGHPPPLLQSVGSGGGVQELAPTGPLMGRLSRAEYGERELPLAPGDRLLLFTDGIPEHLSPAGELFGDERLAAFLVEHPGLAPEPLAAALLDRLASWSGGAGERGERADDLTLVVLQLDPAAGPAGGSR